MAKKITIDLEKLQNPDGSFSERDLETIEKATGVPYAEALKNADNGHQGFTEKEVTNMTDSEYEKNRSQILHSMNN